ncbi:phosphoglycerate kinase [Treponema primitia ZAS-2]|uniref:Phosphoglycerate kinase n=1 Tax=Treponema primitia (strain ATCC BAA-887 / DSM 12427 / ZAS-2) TaxID=545694 RepID=F5YMA7_TREPZ|nr:phosphoglycerate kinase [Treponema primitia]AEF86868.1 phosphoglycerate kinase [Treponema primitia ZAS-2]
MRFGINTLDDIDVKDKTVLCRVDINQPVDRATGTLKDTTRIEACIPTLKELNSKGAKLVLLAHQGSDIEYKNFYTTEPHAKALSKFLGKEVKFIDDVCGPAAREAIKALKSGDILLLDNVRFVSEEQTLFETKLLLSHEEQAKTLLVRKLAPLGDVYVCDAFAAAHRDQPSLCGFEQLLPSAMGRLFEEEFCVVSGLMEKPERPCVFVLGGAKISDAFLMMNAVLGGGSADKVLSGGLVGEVLLWADGKDIGEPARAFIKKEGYENLVETAKELLAKYRDKIVMPTDFASVEAGKRVEYPPGKIPTAALILDIGAETAKKYQEAIRSAKTVFVNGPMGVFEEAATEAGTRLVWDALGDTAAYTVIGGGDSITATKKYGKTADINYICTGGGALIRFLTGDELPVVKALRHGSGIKQKK